MPTAYLESSREPADKPGLGVIPDSPARALLCQLLSSSLVLIEDWERLVAETRSDILACHETDDLLRRLVAAKLLTDYQASRLKAGKQFGLVLGNYRILDRIGAGGMGIVFRGEHVRMRRQVAVKVLAASESQDPRMLTRFFAEVRAVAQLQHPHIVSAFDAGEADSGDPDAPVLHYYVMELIQGQDLESLVRDHGALEPVLACDLIHQVADALLEAHKHGLIHRDIKPSNILMTAEHRAKLLDFGLARWAVPTRLTEQGAVLGTVGYMPPEQAQDASSVDERADIYSLGCTLFWCLTGKDPFPTQGNVVSDLVRRLTSEPPSVRLHRPEVAPELSEVVARMMATNPEDRYPNMQAVMRALLPHLQGSATADPWTRAIPAEAAGPRNTLLINPPTVLVADDEADIRLFCRIALRGEGIQCEDAPDGQAALEALRARSFDLVLLDIDMPGLSGPEVLRLIRQSPPTPRLKVVMLSGRIGSDDLSTMLLNGADDFVSKPFSAVQLRARVKAALRLKEAQERSDLLNQNLLAANSELERSLSIRDGDLLKARNALVLALAKLVEQRSAETGAHLMRLQRYCRVLAEAAAELPDLGQRIDEGFVQLLECCAPLHDIGKVALPDHILMKPGRLDPDERMLMQAHTTIGADTLKEVARQHGFALPFLQMAIDIARHHHERFDGTGYPDRLVGDDIPLAARVVALADVYDAMRSRRVYKPALSHNTAVLAMLEASPGHFDPQLLPVFEQIAPQFDRIFRELSD